MSLGESLSAFWAKVDKSGDCWVWTGRVNSGGYGRPRMMGREVLAHRLSWELAHGPIPEGVFIDHMCHNTRCVNPGHLRRADHTMNMQNREGARKDSTSGVRGVWKDHEKERWVGQVAAFGKKYRKRFQKFEDAERWVTETRNKLYR